MSEVITDAIGVRDGAISANGSVAQRLLSSGFRTNSLRTLETLRKDEWELLDTDIVEPGRERLRAAGDLISRGLVLPVPNGLGTTIVQHETASEMTAADVSMDGRTRGEQDRIVFSLVSTPLPIIHKDFQLNIRALEASRNGGSPLDTTQAVEAAIQVSETVEGMVLNGFAANDILGFGASSGQLYGYTNAPNRNTSTLGTSWATDTGANILADVLTMITGLQGDRMYGPYMLYVPTNSWVPLLDDFKAESDKTIIQRIKEIPEIIDVKPVDKLADDNVLMVQMTKNVVDMAIGMQPTVLQWDTDGGMNLNFKVMSIMVPRMKSDYQSFSGVNHMS